MIDTKELRRLTKAALIGPDGVSLNWLKLLQDFQKEANPAAISELLDRLEEAESDALEQARLNGMGSEREAALMAKLEAAEKEIESWKGLAKQFGNEADALRAAVRHEADCVEACKAEVETLRARIEAMEKQESAAWMLNCQTLGGDTGWILSWTQSGAGLCNRLRGEENEKKLYALPGAKGEKK